jgi:hypothetical protein
MKVTPFYANLSLHPHLGTEPPRLKPMAPLDTAQYESADELSERLTKIHYFASSKLCSAHENPDRAANSSHCSVPLIKVRDQVWLDSRNVRINRPAKKLDWKNNSPFTVVEVSGPHTYRLDQPTSMRIHNIFHVFLLRLVTFYPMPNQHAPPPPPVMVDEEEEYLVEEILESRV